MPKDTKTLGNNKARACESLGFVHKKRLCQRFDTTSFLKRYKGIIYQNGKINGSTNIITIPMIICNGNPTFT